MTHDLWLPQGADEKYVARALREYDPALRLIPGLPRAGIPYKVYAYRGDQPAVFICAWEENGKALPLSTRLLEMVKQQDRTTRSPAPDADVLEARRRERLAKDEDAMAQDLIDDWRGREGRSAMLPRSQSLRRARDKARARGEKV